MSNCAQQTNIDYDLALTLRYHITLCANEVMINTDVSNTL